MARKKSSVAAADPISQEDANNNLKPHKSPRDQSPDKKMDNLKTLNHLLLKEAMEKRNQIDSLKTHIDDLEISLPISSEIEQEVRTLVFAVKIGEEMKKTRSLMERLDSVTRERDEVREEAKKMQSLTERLDFLSKERDSKVGELEARVLDLEKGNVEMKKRLGKAEAERDEMERLGRKKEEAFESVTEMIEDVEREREEMRIRHEKEIERFGRKIRALEEGAEKERERLMLEASELKERYEEGQEEIRKLMGIVGKLEAENEEKKNVYESKAGELELKLCELSKKMGEVLGEKKEMENLRAEQEVVILHLTSEAEKLRLNVAELEKECRNADDNNEQLVRQNSAVKDELDALKKEMFEREKGFEAKVGELMMKLDDMSVRMKEILAEKDEVETVKSKLDVETVDLRETLEKLSSKVVELEERCRDHNERSTQLLDERDAVERELGVHRDESGRLRLQVQELEKSKDESLKDLKKLNALLDKLVSEKEEGKRQIESLFKEKAMLEKTLLKAKEDCNLMMKKASAAEMISDKALCLLKSATEAMNGAETVQENGAVVDDEIRPFAEELESIKGAFKSRELKIEDMNGELQVMKTAVEDAKKKKKKPGLLMWLYPATTTVLAAISFAYAARGR